MHRIRYDGSMRFPKSYQEFVDNTDPRILQVRRLIGSSDPVVSRKAVRLYRRYMNACAEAYRRHHKTGYYKRGEGHGIGYSMQCHADLGLIFGLSPSIHGEGKKTVVQTPSVRRHPKVPSESMEKLRSWNKISPEKRYGVPRADVWKQTKRLLEEAYASDPVRIQEAIERITGQSAFVFSNLTTRQLSAIRTVAMAIVLESRGHARSRNRAAPFAPPKFVGHRERTQETVGGYPVGTDFGYYVRATARELEKLVRSHNSGLIGSRFKDYHGNWKRVGQQEIDFTVSKSLMRCDDRMRANFQGGKDPKWSAKNVYRACVSQLSWPWHVSPPPTESQRWPDFSRSKPKSRCPSPRPCRVASVTTWKYK